MVGLPLLAMKPRLRPAVYPSFLFKTVFLPLLAPLPPPQAKKN
jgi:hypothetical protein